MKKLIYLFIGLLMLLSICPNSNGTEINNEISKEGSITVLCSPDLYNLTNRWVEEYGKLNQNLKIKVLKIGHNSVDNAYSSDFNVGLVSESSLYLLEKPTNLSLIVGRDILVPIMNTNNPLKIEIFTHGISSGKLAGFFKSQGDHNWGSLLNIESNLPIHYYKSDNDEISSTVEEFLKMNGIAIEGINVANNQEVIASVQKDIYSIAFCRVTDVIDPMNNGMLENITLLPIDRNGNGKMDSFEQIFDDLNTFSRGVWIGKHAKELISNIYAVSNESIDNGKEKEFIKWMLTDGQQFLSSNGYSDLILSERLSKLDVLYNDQIIPNAIENLNYGRQKVGLFILIIVTIIGLIVGSTFYFKRQKSTEKPTLISKPIGYFDAKSINVPNGLFFDKTHTWVYMEMDGVLRIGINDFITRITGNLTGIKMKNPGEEIRKGDTIITLMQNGKQLNIKSPVSGIISQQNEKLITNAAIINECPYSEGWIYVIEPTNWFREIQFLFMAEKFKKWLISEFTRLKDFLSQTQNMPLVLQEGGELKEAVLADHRPEVWEDFQSNFIDTAL
ncbi:MAG: hypothetical protein CVU00_05515 [Bacteroidetes bacterium HGW-Bacteroidetes-17]|nr:MAG: hypothetical protein CVU00_05515 [Bacteroidetes bacterium HGW-Bacteroidetes-17]